MERKQLIRELKYFLIRALFLDISAYLISAFFIGFTLPMALGLALGTAGMAVNLILLNGSIRNIVKNGAGGAKKKMLTGYMFRIGLTACIVTLAMLLPCFNTAGAVIPYFYPNIVYAGNALLRKGEKTE